MTTRSKKIKGDDQIIIEGLIDRSEEENKSENNTQINSKMSNDQNELSEQSLNLIYYSNVEKTIPVFEGDTGMNINTWLKNFEANAVAYGWNEVQKFVFARNKMVKSADLFLQSVTVCDYITLKKLLVEEFQKEYSSAEIHAQLRERKKNDNESIWEYMLHMRRIGSFGEVDERSIIRYIVDGIKGKPEYKIGLYSVKSYKELKEQYEIYERIYKYKFETKEQNVQTKKKKVNKTYRCYNCGSEDHKKSDCPQNEPKCFKCNKTGHISTSCKEQNVRKVNCTMSETILKTIKINGKNFKSLIDSGADISLVKESIFNKKIKEKFKPYKQEIIGFGGAVTIPKGIVNVNSDFDGHSINHNLVVVPDSSISYNVIIGLDVLNKFRYTSDENGYTFHSLIKTTVENECNKIMNIYVETKDDVIAPLSYKDEIKNIKKNYVPQQKMEIPTAMKIILEKENPIYSTPSRLPQPEQEIVDEQVEEWLKSGKIRKSTSQYCSRVVLANKKDGSKRVCIDYRRLNKVCLKDRFPVPNMEDLIDGLTGSSVFSVLDIKNAFLHVPIDEKSKKYTAFVTKQGIYEFNYAPFGFCNSPSAFIRFINIIFRELVNENIMKIYMDDIIVHSKDEVIGIEYLRQVLKVAAENNLEINWKKCKFLQRRVEFLGMVIEHGTVKPSEEKLKAVKNFPFPKNIRDIQSFLGLTGFFRKFIQNYSVIARPLTNLLKKRVKFEINDGIKKSFQTLQNMLVSQPVLRIYCRDANTELHTDASSLGFGAILMQEFDGKWYPVYYYSRKTSDSEVNLHSYHLEIKAAFLAMKRLRHYLLGLKFVLVTDCLAFKQTSRKEDLQSSISRYIMYMQDFQFDLKHRKGERMRHVDALSRHAVNVVDLEGDLKCRLQKSQKTDDSLKAIVEILNVHPYENFKIIGGVLCKEVEGNYVFVVPRQMEKEIITKTHENGHFGAAKTIHLIKQQYFIPHLENKVNNVIRNCIKCILYNKKQGKLEGFLECIDKGEKPLCTIHIDHLGPMDSTSKQYKHIFAVVDSFSKFLWLYPTKSTGVEEVLTKLECWQSIFGNPQRIISDKGRAFTSHAFQTFCNEAGIEHIQTTTGVPRANGQIERVNRTIISVISKLSSEKPEKWYKEVNNVQQAINSSFHRSTGHSPFEILFGVKMRNKNFNNVVEILQNQLINDFNTERDQLRYEAKQQIHKIQIENRKNFNRRRKKNFEYKVGDVVAIKRTQFIAGKKLSNEYLGPYEVRKVKRNGRYEVCKAASFEGPNSTSTSNDNMKLWRLSAVDDESCSSSEADV